MMNSVAASDGSDNVSRFSALVNLTYFFNVRDLLGETAFFLGSCFAILEAGQALQIFTALGRRCLLYFFLDAVCNGIKSSSLVIVDM